MPRPSSASGDSILFHRNIAFAVGHERLGVRDWVIYPSNGPIDGGARGKVRAQGGLGSFRLAVQAAHSAIDEMLSAEAYAPQTPAQHAPPPPTA